MNGHPKKFCRRLIDQFSSDIILIATRDNKKNNSIKNNNDNNNDNNNMILVNFKNNFHDMPTCVFLSEN